MNFDFDSKFDFDFSAFHPASGNRESKTRNMNLQTGKDERQNADAKENET